MCLQNIRDANDEIKNAYGMIIDGRQIRLEQAKAERKLS